MRVKFPANVPTLPSERFTAKAAAGCFTHRSKPRSIVRIPCAATEVIKRSLNGGASMRDKTASVRPAAIPLHPSGRMQSSAVMPVGRKHTVEALRIRQVDKMTTYNNRNGNKNNVIDISSGQKDHLPKRNEKSQNETFHFQYNRYG